MGYFLLPTNGNEHPLWALLVHLFKNGKYTGEGTLYGVVYRQRTLWVMRCGINQCYDWSTEMRSVARAE
jgi:hypothetical protein